MNYDPLKTIISNPDWMAVEQVMEKYLSEMFDLRNIDTKLSAEDYKIECVSRLRAAENLHKFYKTNAFISKRIEDISGSFR